MNKETALDNLIGSTVNLYSDLGVLTAPLSYSEEKWCWAMINESVHVYFDIEEVYHVEHDDIYLYANPR